MEHSCSYYELLGVSPSADHETLHKAFRALSKSLHPDTTELPKEEASQKFQRLCEAYELLIDPEKRKRYDQDLSIENNLELRQGSYEKSFYLVENNIEVRRDLSGGEWFSLLMLVVSLLLCLLIALLFGMASGRDWQVKPAWMFIYQDFKNLSFHLF